MMRLNNRFALFGALALCLVLLGCIGSPSGGAGGTCGTCPLGTDLQVNPSNNACSCAPQFWNNSWQSIAISGLLALSFGLAILYMIAEGFEFQHLKYSVRDEIVQVAISAFFVFALASFVWAGHNLLLPGLVNTSEIEVGSADTQAFCPPADYNVVGPDGSLDPFAFSLCYTDNVKASLAGFSAGIEATALGVGKVSSVTTYCQLLGGTLGFAITPCRYIGSTQGTLSLALTALTSAQIAMQAQQLLLSIAQQFVVFLLPLGILMRCLRPTRSAGGALIAIAVGFFFVYPLLVMVNYTMAKEMAFSTDAPYAPANVMLPPAPQSEIGVCTGDQEYLDGIMNREGFIQPLAYWVIIVSILMPVMNMLVALTFIRWFAALMGSEIEVSQLARVT